MIIQTDPLEALLHFKSESETFDLVVTDMTMPNMKGDTFALELKRIRPILLKELTQLIRKVLDGDPVDVSS